jgi:hypothetical protein
VEVFTELAKAWGPPGLLALVLWWQLDKSEKREAAKDTRIQLLENKLIESYDERIEAAGQVTEAVFSAANSIKEMKETVQKLMTEKKR